ncbi:MAG: M1 family metallopeptidase [Planctomycetes bacterium]|nr:M1 family metallopeptidase [Planctomycetota bacterium]
MIQRFVSTAVRLSCLASALFPALAATLSESVYAQDREGAVGAKPFEDRFRQLEEILPTPNAYRTASGAPGHGYWQQKVDYDIAVELDDSKQTLHGRERIRYANRSPDTLRYLWLQLEGNLFTPGSDQKTTATFDEAGKDMQFSRMRQLLAARDFDGGFKIDHVTSGGRDLDYTIVKTMMRVDLPSDAPLGPGASCEFDVEWHYKINQHKYVPGRSGAEFFENDGNWIYEVAHWFPRLCAYTDTNGWQHKQFLGRGEFTLEFGDYDVRITVPEDHVVAATGQLRNPDDVLRPVWRERLARARVSSDPVFIVTPDEAKANQSSRTDRKATWIFHADNVRDFSWASSRKFIWDAQGHHSAACAGDGIVLAMSYWPIEGEPLWSRYSTRAVVHTLESYGKFAFDYPYPVAISVNGPVGGMEYPMICFNGPRPEADGTYSARTKYGLISVVIHEVGHNWFPMIVNSDERQWTWMDEGLNTFVQYLAEKEWEDKYPSWTGEPRQITDYMASALQVPIMTNSESILQFGPNAYFKPATALNILRETILGRELFDFAFREYARRWRFSRPMPADFFRTMEDASGIDLDWFWRGWFYSTDHVDIALSDVREYAIDRGDPDARASIAKNDRAKNEATVSAERNKELPKKVERVPQLADFYNRFDDLDPTVKDRERFEKFVASLDEDERKLLATEGHFYVLDFDNEGGLVMPILLRMHHADGTHAWLRMPAEIWRKSPRHVKKLIYSEQEIVRFVVDPMGETADVDESDNEWPRRRAVSRFRLFKDAKEKNPMQEANEAAKKARASGATGADDGAAPKDSGGDR